MRNTFHKDEEEMLKKNVVDVETVDNHGKNTESRVSWSKQIEFLLSCIGYAVGLGNLWRFPYLCIRNGGGAFLIPYFIFLFLCGLPLFYMELILGQFSGLSPISVWRLCPLIKGLGWGMIIVSAIICLYYNIILSWVLYYLAVSLQAEVPWKTCDNSWNTENCTTRVQHINGSLSNYTLPESNTTSEGTTSAAEEFWHYRVLNISGGITELGGIRWQLLLCLFISWLLVYLCLYKGIKSSGKVVYVTATVPYLFLTILLVRGVTLPGSLDGIKFYIIPEWHKLLKFEVWIEACLQIFYSLGPAWGGLITMASYNKFHHNCLRDAVAVCLTCSGTSFFAGFVIFSIIGFMAHESGVSVKDVITQGPGLAFIAYPEAIAHLPISPFWAVCFFLMLLTLGLDSVFVTFETVTSSFIDEFPHILRKRQKLFIFVLCFAMFLLGLPLTTRAGMYIFQILDWYAAAFSVVVISFTECITICYIYGIGRFYSDIELISRRKPSYVWAVLWCSITPCLLLIILVVSVMQLKPPTYGQYVYPWWVQLTGWFVASLSIIPLPSVAIYKLLTAKGTIYQRLTCLLTPTEDWGPFPEKYRLHYNSNKFCSWKQRLLFTTHTSVHNHNEDTKQEDIALNHVKETDS